MPERPWDSPFRALVPGNGAEPVSRSISLAPLRKPLPSFSSEEEKEIRGVARPQSLVHRPGPYPPDDPKTVRQADALLGSCLPRVFSPCDQRNRSPELPRACVVVLTPTGARESTTDVRLGALPEAGIGLASREASDPSEVSNLIVKLASETCADQSRMNSLTNVGASPP